MRRRSGKKQRRNAAKRGSGLGSIIAFPVVALLSIVKLPLIVVAFAIRAIGSVLMAIVKFLPAVVGAVGSVIASAFRMLLRIPFGSIGKVLLSGLVLVWRLVASTIFMVFRILSNPRGLALFALVLIIVLAAAYAESSLGSILVVAILMAGAFWMFKQPEFVHFARNLELGKPHTHAPLAHGTRNLDKIYALTPREFEEFVRDVLTDLGFRHLTVVGGPRDLGVDIVGHDARGRSVAVQCKRYAPGQRIGSQTMQTFIGMQRIQHGADKGIFVTTADFTRDARALADRHDIWLINGAELVGLVRGGLSAIGR